MQEVRFTRSARKHRIGKARALYVMETVEPVTLPAEGDTDARLVWVGQDDRDLELEIVAVDLPGLLLVIHVMPTNLRRN